jgi:hypothetical protein
MKPRVRDADVSEFKDVPVIGVFVKTRAVSRMR